MIIDRQEQNFAMEGVEREYALSLRDILGVLGRRFWLIALPVVLALGIATGFSLYMTPEYVASSTMLVGQSNSIAQNPQEALGLQQLTGTVTQAGRSRSVAEDVIERLGLRESAGELQGNLSVRQVSTTQFIDISYQDADPKRAQEIANAVAETLSERISGEGSSPRVTATVWEEASLPDKPVKPDLKLMLLAALVLGVTLGVGLAFLPEYLNGGWRSRKEAKKETS